VFIVAFLTLEIPSCLLRGRFGKFALTVACGTYLVIIWLMIMLVERRIIIRHVDFATWTPLPRRIGSLLSRVSTPNNKGPSMSYRCPRKGLNDYCGGICGEQKSSRQGRHELSRAIGRRLSL
jgi:hypothetical protein